MAVNVTYDDFEDECDDHRDYRGGWLGVSDGLLVLFTEKGVGTVLVASDADEFTQCFEFGENYDGFDMSMFDAYHGVVMLANDDVELGDDEA